jgi:hypothetical protein
MVRRGFLCVNASFFPFTQDRSFSSRELQAEFPKAHTQRDISFYRMFRVVVLLGFLGFGQHTLSANCSAKRHAF